MNTLDSRRTGAPTKLYVPCVLVQRTTPTQTRTLYSPSKLTNNPAIETSFIKKEDEEAN